MKSIRIHRKDVVTMLEEKGPITTREMIKELQCSRSTLYTKLKGIPHITSSNKNGKYHVLQTMAKYDQNGLWRSGDIVFSKWGTLDHTIQHLVDSSKAGLSSFDLESILNTKIVPQLVALRKAKRIVRMRYGRHLVYYCIDPVTKKSQMKKRSDLIGCPKEVERRMSKDKVIIILTTIVKYHAVSFDDAMEILSSEGIFVTDMELTWIFTKYRLKKGGLTSRIEGTL